MFEFYFGDALIVYFLTYTTAALRRQPSETSRTTNQFRSVTKMLWNLPRIFSAGPTKQNCDGRMSPDASGLSRVPLVNDSMLTDPFFQSVYTSSSLLLETQMSYMWATVCEFTCDTCWQLLTSTNNAKSNLSHFTISVGIWQRHLDLVLLSVRPSVCHVVVLYLKECTYRQTSLTTCLVARRSTSWSRGQVLSVLHYAVLAQTTCTSTATARNCQTICESSDDVFCSSRLQRTETGYKRQCHTQRRPHMSKITTA